MKKYYFTLLALTASLVACQKNVYFTGPQILGNGESGNNSKPVCHIDMIEKAKPTNILFIVDQSGSNATGNSGGVGTDPKKSFRFGILNKFISEHGSKNHLSWNLTTFANKTAQSLVKENKPFTQTLPLLLQGLNTFMNTQDKGYTPYRAALRLAKDLVVKSEQNAKDPQTTLIAFITDGVPTDYCTKPNDTSCPGKILESEIDKDVRSILDASQGEVEFSALYYGPPDLEASQRLERMAKVGGGQFVDLNKSSNIDLNDVIQVPETVCSAP